MTNDKDLFLEYIRKNPPIDKDLFQSQKKFQRAKRSANRSYDQVLDFHGMDRSRALQLLQDAIAKAKQHGMRRILVIHGLGHHSLEGQRGVLKETTRSFLESMVGKGISGYSVAPSKDGGEGATVVRIF
jgi:DNA-nicking Smr family endonuclease